MSRAPKVRYILGELVGHVTSIAQQKTAIVRVPRWHRMPKIDFDVRRNTKHWAHDEYGLCSVGDMVRIEPCRALSKRKAHVVVEIIKKEDGTPPPDPFPKW